MISIVLYGRNDNYGYNLHKRAALSLNCMAEVLTGNADEILFVDYNTPDDFPTFPEAIQDTLTERARDILRILRVRPTIHERFSKRTTLQTVEPVARNIAIRRSAPDNRWILSTNTDMIFVPRRGDSLTALAGDLDPGIYCTPRFEIPEGIWETFDRLDPKGVIEAARQWGWDLHLNEIVHGNRFIRYDGPGDFQLMSRHELFAIHGFDEEMLLGWHVDSNISKRLSLLHGTVGDMVEMVFGYHCDHTRQATPAHQRAAVTNSITRFVTDIADPVATHQAESWGCPNDEIEEIRLARTPGQVYLNGLREAIGDPLARPIQSRYTDESFGEMAYEPQHVLPYLADLFVSLPRHWNLAWFGASPGLFGRIITMWRALGFTGEILTADGFPRIADDSQIVRVAPESELIDKANLFVFDYVGPEGGMNEPAAARVLEAVIAAFERVAEAESRRLLAGHGPPRRMVGINAVHNRFEGPFKARVAITRTPFSARIRHGFAVPTEADVIQFTQSEGMVGPLRVDWLPQMIVGDGGEAGPSQVRFRQDRPGTVVVGPLGNRLSPGTYCLEMKLEYQGLRLPDWRHLTRSLLWIEIYVGELLILRRKLRAPSLLFTTHRVLFEIPASALDAAEVMPVEVRIKTRSRLRAAIRALVVERIGARRQAVRRARV